MDVIQFMSSDNAIVGSVKRSFVNFDTPSAFEDKVTEVKLKVDALIEHQQNEVGFSSPYKQRQSERNFDLFDKRSSILV